MKNDNISLLLQSFNLSEKTSQRDDFDIIEKEVDGVMVQVKVYKEFNSRNRKKTWACCKTRGRQSRDEV